MNEDSDNAVSLVIPGRNCARTIRQCLEAVVSLMDQKDSRLAEIIFVDDGSTDETAKIVADYPVTCISGSGGGPGAARNIGWRTAASPLIWFVDSDCVAEPNALQLLLAHMDDPEVGGAGGSYGTMTADSLLSCLIHEEIVERHAAMSAKVNFLATFNVIYRRSVLDRIGGFDERYLKAQDAELAFRVMDAGFGLRFEFDSRVRHYHPTRWASYLRTQRQQGYWRVWLHMQHTGHATGDSYSSVVDHAQPPLAMMTLPALALLAISLLQWIPIALVLLLATLQLPMTIRLLKRLRRMRYLGYAPMSFVRAYWRGIGMTQGVFAYAASKLRGGK